MPTHGPLSRAHAALAAVGRMVPPPDELLVVVDGPQTAADQTCLPAHSVVIEVPPASGPARARNAAAAVATGDLLLFIDSDVEVPSWTVRRVIEEFARHPGMAAMFGSYDDSPSDPGILSQYRNLLHHFVHQKSEARATTFWAGLGAVRATVFRSVGGFDAHYRKPSVEDIELGYRMSAAGHEIRLVHDLQGKHHKRWTAMGILKTDLWSRGIPWMQLILRRGGAPRDLNLRWNQRLSVAFSGLLLVSVACAWKWAWCGWMVLATGGGLILLNMAFYRFLVSRRGWGFLLCVLPWHWVHYLECGLAVPLGFARHLTTRGAVVGNPESRR